MATDGYGHNLYDALSSIIHAPVYPLAVDELLGEPLGYGSSFVGRFLKAFSPEGFVATFEQADLIEGLLQCLHNGWVSKAGPGMRHGTWDHFKGGIYLSLGTATHAETDQHEVEYISLLHGTKHHRRCEQWNDVVRWPDGKYRSRFIYRGADLESCDPPSFKTPLSDKTRAHVARTMLSVL